MTGNSSPRYCFPQTAESRTATSHLKTSLSELKVLLSSSVTRWHCNITVRPAIIFNTAKYSRDKRYPRSHKITKKTLKILGSTKIRHSAKIIYKWLIFLVYTDGIADAKYPQAERPSCHPANHIFHTEGTMHGRRWPKNWEKEWLVCIANLQTRTRHVDFLLLVFENHEKKSLPP